MNARRKAFAQLLLFVTTGAAAGGCASNHSFLSFIQKNDSEISSTIVSTENRVGAPMPTPHESLPREIHVQRVAFEDTLSSEEGKNETSEDPALEFGEEKDDHKTSRVQVAVPYLKKDSSTDATAFLIDAQQTLGTMSLDDFESLALVNNPTIAQLVASTQKAAGFRTQVGLRPNPTLGYQGMQIADAGTDQHTIYLSQTIVTADKLALNRRVLNEAIRAQLLELEAQKYRVATDVRVKFYDALAAQRRIALIRDFQSVADKGLELAQLRKKALEGSQLEVVQAKVQKNEIDLTLQQAEVAFAGSWRELVAITGDTNLAPVVLQGELPVMVPSVDWPSLASTMVESSPEYQSAQMRINQARANLERQCVQPIPNLDVQIAAGADNGTDSGMINVQVGAPIPVFNKNQGNIGAARAEFVRASKEAERIENSIKSRLGAVSRDYDSALAAVTKYAKDILPNAKEGLELAEIAYKAGETSFVQVLVARRTYFDSNLQYIISQTQLAQARAMLDGYVLTGALNSTIDDSGDDSLRGLTLSQQ